MEYNEIKRKKMKNSIKWLTLLMAIAVLVLYVFVGISVKEDNCVHGDYWLTSLEEDGKSYVFSCKTDKGESHMYSQAKRHMITC